MPDYIVDPDDAEDHRISKEKAVSKGLKRYFNAERCPKGHLSYRYVRNGYCVQCCNESVKRAVEKNPERVKNWRKNNAEKIRANVRALWKANKDRYDKARKRWEDDNSEYRADYDRRYREANKDRYKEYRKNNADRMREWKRLWRDKNIDIVRAQYAKRRASKRQACPTWADLEAINLIYKNCPPGHHVDHVVPLAGITPEGSPVCGLHVEYNLRYLPASDNMSRCNRITELEIQELEFFNLNKEDV